MKKTYSPQAGFSLVEMIVSLGVFSIVITIAVGALLMMIASNDQLQEEQSVMTNLSFALDSMTREIRTGTEYYCETRNSDGDVNNIFNDSNDIDYILNSYTNDCPAGRSPSVHNFQGIAFKESGDSITGGDERILYYFNKNENKIFRRVGASAAQPITSSGIHIENAEFYVTSSDSVSGGDENQASVTIFIQARDPDDPNSKLHEIQTTITQRSLDI